MLDACTHLQLKFVPSQPVGLHPQADLVCDPLGLFGLAASQQDRELVAAEPRNGVVVAHSLDQKRADLFQQCIAGSMAAGVVIRVASMPDRRSTLSSVAFTNTRLGAC